LQETRLGVLVVENIGEKKKGGKKGKKGSKRIEEGR
jgi:hypothetical protein